MKKRYITPTISTIKVDLDNLMDGNATSWTDPDGNHHAVIPGNPDSEDNTPDEAKKNTRWDYDTPDKWGVSWD